MKWMSQKDPGRMKAHSAPEEHQEKHSELYGLQTLMQEIETEKQQTTWRYIQKLCFWNLKFHNSKKFKDS